MKIESVQEWAEYENDSVLGEGFGARISKQAKTFGMEK